VIFNCSGIGSYELNQDGALFPIYGHLILLKGSAPMNYMVATIVMQNGKEEPFYFFPKSLSVTSTNPDGTACSGVIGGTFLTTDEQWNNEEEFSKLLERASLFFQGTPLPR